MGSLKQRKAIPGNASLLNAPDQLEGVRRSKGGGRRTRERSRPPQPSRTLLLEQLTLPHRSPRHYTRVTLQVSTKVAQETCPLSFNTPMVQKAEAEIFDFSDGDPQGSGVSPLLWGLLGRGEQGKCGGEPVRPGSPSSSGDTRHKGKRALQETKSEFNNIEQAKTLSSGMLPTRRADAWFSTDL